MRAVKTINRKLWHKLIIVDIKTLNNPKYNDYNYYTIRAQRISADREYRNSFNGLRKIYETEVYEGNAINLYNRIKSNFKKDATFIKNTIKLNQDINIEEFEYNLNEFCNDVKNDFEN
jgi:hypothetical protein